MNIAIFKPGNARNNNSFNSGQYPIFRKLNESVDYNFTIFVDDPKVAFDGISIEYLERNKMIGRRPSPRIEISYIYRIIERICKR